LKTDLNAHVKDSTERRLELAVLAQKQEQEVALVKKDQEYFKENQNKVEKNIENIYEILGEIKTLLITSKGN
jgi:hypothetical protein